VEDDRINRLLLAKFLKESFNAEVLEAADGAHAWEIIRLQKPRIVLLDLYLPLMSGVEIFQEIKKNPLLSDLKVLIMSSLSDKSVVETLIAKGAADYLLKPVDQKALRERLENIIDAMKKDTSTEVKEKIIIAEPDDKFRSMLATILKTKYDVLGTNSGFKALTLYQESKPQFIIIGENIVGLNAKLLASKIRNYDTAIQPKIILSGEHIDEATLSKNLFDGVLHRQLGTAELIKQLKDMLSS